MFGLLKIVFISVAIVGGIVVKALPLFYNEPILVSQSQSSNIDESSTQNAYNNDTDKDLNSLSNVENPSDNSQSNNDSTNKQENITSTIEKSGNMNNTNKQETISSNMEKPSNSNDTNNQEVGSSKLEESNIIINPNKQETTISSLEKSSNTNYTNKQEVVSSKLEESSNNATNTVANSQLKDSNNGVNTETNSGTNTALEEKIPTIHYDRTTSIYANDNITLLRIEYYANNKLTYYSVIEQFDAEAKSYIEKIYKCNRETNIDPLIRTDVYANGKLIKSY